MRLCKSRMWQPEGESWFVCCWLFFFFNLSRVCCYSEVSVIHCYWLKLFFLLCHASFKVWNAHAFEILSGPFHNWKSQLFTDMNTQFFYFGLFINIEHSEYHRFCFFVADGRTWSLSHQLPIKSQVVYTMHMFGSRCFTPQRDRSKLANCSYKACPTLLDR